MTYVNTILRDTERRKFRLNKCWQLVADFLLPLDSPLQSSQDSCCSLVRWAESLGSFMARYVLNTAISTVSALRLWAKYSLGSMWSTRYTIIYSNRHNYTNLLYSAACSTRATVMKQRGKLCTGIRKEMKEVEEAFYRLECKLYIKHMM